MVATRRSVLSLLATLALPLASAASRSGTIGAAPPGHVNRDEVLTRTFRAEIHGGVVVAGCGMRGSGPPMTTGSITIAGIPADATVLKGILNWTILDVAPPSPDAVFHETTQPAATVTGTSLGQDGSPCWGSFAAIFAFSADVTSRLTTTGNGTYDVSLPDSGSELTPPSAEGATLIVVYCSASSAMTDIVVYEGCETQIGGDSIQTVAGFDAPAGPVTFANATWVVSDGQGSTGTASYNGVDVITPVFDGDEGASCTAKSRLYFDVDTIDVAALTLPGDRFSTAVVTSFSDCLTWSALVLAVATDTIDDAGYGCAGPTCPTSPVARPAPGPEVCAGDTATLDGSPSSACGAAGLEFRWLDGAAVVCDWSSAPTCAVTPATSTTYTLAVRCADRPSCTDSTTVRVTVDPFPLPDLTALADACAGTAVTLDASASGDGGCGVPLEYQFREGAAVLQPWGPGATFGPFVPAASTTYAADLRCTATPGCAASAAQPIVVVPYPTPALAPLADVCAGGSVTLDASASIAGGCPIPIEYQFRDGATILQPWSTAATFGPLAPATATTYTVDVRCTATPGCAAAASQAVAVVPYPTAALGALADVCAGTTVLLDASASIAGGCPVPIEYRFRDGATVLAPWSTTATFGPLAPAATTTYSVDVRCTATPGCATSATRTVDVVPFPATALAPLAPGCAGATVTLDASGSSPAGCPVPLEYQFRDGATVLQAWGTAATHGPITPLAGTTYTTDVRCTATPGCSASASQAHTVVPIPTASAGTDIQICRTAPATLDGAGLAAPGCSGGPLFEWRQGTTVLRASSAVPTWSPPTTVVGTTTYTLIAACSTLPACASADDVVVTVMTCPLAVHWDRFDAVRGAGGVEVSWQTALEDGTIAFAVERAGTPGGPFAIVGDALPARGAGFAYALSDPAAPPGAWYRIVEVTVDGRGDVTPVFAAHPPAEPRRSPAATGSSRGRRGPGRGR